jgi:hypothetical protein
MFRSTVGRTFGVSVAPAASFPLAEPLPPHLPYATTLCCRNIWRSASKNVLGPVTTADTDPAVSYLCTEGGRPSGGDPKSTVADVDANSTLF